MRSRPTARKVLHAPTLTYACSADPVTFGLAQDLINSFLDLAVHSSTSAAARAAALVGVTDLSAHFPVDALLAPPTAVKAETAYDFALGGKSDDTAVRGPSPDPSSPSSSLPLLTLSPRAVRFHPIRPRLLPQLH